MAVSWIFGFSCDFVGQQGLQGGIVKRGSIGEGLCWVAGKGGEENKKAYLFIFEEKK